MIIRPLDSKIGSSCCFQALIRHAWGEQTNWSIKAIVSDTTTQFRRRITMLTVAFTASIFVSGAVYFVANDLQYRLSDDQVVAFDRLLDQPVAVQDPVRAKRIEPAPLYDEPAAMTALPYPHSVALGRPDRGALQHHAKLTASRHFVVREGHNYGTQELIDALKEQGEPCTMRMVQPQDYTLGTFPYAMVVHSPRTGPTNQAVTLIWGYYLRKNHDPTTMGLATPRKLDVARTWTFLESLLLEGNIDIFSLTGASFPYCSVKPSLRPLHPTRTKPMVPKR